MRGPARTAPQILPCRSRHRGSYLLALGVFPTHLKNAGEWRWGASPGRMALGMIDAQQIGGYRDLLFGGPATSNAKNVERSGDMSYPPPRYNGTTGETSAIFRSGVHGPELVYPSGGTVHYLATGASTAGEFGLYRWHFAASASGPDPHFHRSISESFFILSGTVRLYDGN